MQAIGKTVDAEVRGRDAAGKREGWWLGRRDYVRLMGLGLGSEFGRMACNVTKYEGTYLI